eukprot:TRINITY_DN7539_c1_g1_i2.p2 TRINITY_DN7539_c1_g1~~TRINITY_DN7539_c1_g1_i2.p2  ORF type:complete len:161 (+),score=18.32 TRINITY_DN7539_c1_g1_i2:36-485(+)
MQTKAGLILARFQLNASKPKDLIDLHVWQSSFDQSWLAYRQLSNKEYGMVRKGQTCGLNLAKDKQYAIVAQISQENRKSSGNSNSYPRKKQRTSTKKDDNQSELIEPPSVSSKSNISDDSQILEEALELKKSLPSISLEELIKNIRSKK